MYICTLSHRYAKSSKNNKMHSDLRIRPKTQILTCSDQKLHSKTKKLREIYSRQTPHAPLFLSSDVPSATSMSIYDALMHPKSLKSTQLWRSNQNISFETLRHKITPHKQKIMRELLKTNTTWIIFSITEGPITDIWVDLWGIDASENRYEMSQIPGFHENPRISLVRCAGVFIELFSSQGLWITLVVSIKNILKASFHSIRVPVTRPWVGTCMQQSNAKTRKLLKKSW